MKIALYVRVSTTRQQQTQTIEQQLSRLRQHLETQPSWELVEQHIYRDDGYSGAQLIVRAWIVSATMPRWQLSSVF